MVLPGSAGEVVRLEGMGSTPPTSSGRGIVLRMCYAVSGTDVGMGLRVGGMGGMGSPFGVRRRTGSEADSSSRLKKKDFIAYRELVLDQVRTYARMHVCAYARMHVCAYARMHVCAYARIRAAQV
eukprot:2836741-Rhodomonas_salina.3